MARRGPARAPRMEAVAFEGVPAALFLGSSASLVLRPQEAVLGYEG